MDRRHFLKATGIIAAGLAFLGIMPKVQATEVDYAAVDRSTWPRWKADYTHDVTIYDVKWNSDPNDMIESAVLLGRHKTTGHIKPYIISVPKEELDYFDNAVEMKDRLIAEMLENMRRDGYEAIDKSRNSW